jgi:hypothetical protein
MKVVASFALVGSSAVAFANAGSLRGQQRAMSGNSEMGIGHFKYLQVTEVGYDYMAFSSDNTDDAQRQYIFDFEQDYKPMDGLHPFTTVQVIDNLKCGSQTVNTTVSSEKTLVESLEKGISFDVAVPIPLERRRLDEQKGKKDAKDDEKKDDEKKPLPAPVLKGKFSTSSTYQKVSKQANGDFYKSYMAQFVCQVKTVTIAKDNLPSLYPSFVKRINDMYERAQYGQDILQPMAEAVIDEYGTHYVARASIGASYTRSFSLQGRSSEAAYMTETSNKKSASLSLDASASIGMSTEDKTTTDSFKSFQKTTTVDIASSVGLAPKGDGSSDRATIISNWQDQLIAAGKAGDSSKLGLIVIPTGNSLKFVPLCDLLVSPPYIENQFKRQNHFEDNQNIDEALLKEVREALYRAIYTKCDGCAEPKDGKDLYKDQTIINDEKQMWKSVKWNNPFNGHDSDSNKHAAGADITTKALFGPIGGYVSPTKVNEAVYIDSITLAKGKFQRYSQSTVQGFRFNYKNVLQNNAATSYDYGWGRAIIGDVANTVHIGGRDIVEVQLYSGDLLEGLRFILNEAPSGQSSTECLGNCNFPTLKSFKAPKGGRLIGLGYMCMDGGQTKDNSDCTLGAVWPVWAMS